MKTARAVSFSALLSPAGVHVVAYRRTGGRVRVERYSRELRNLAVGEVADVLANLLESEGARGRRVAIAVTGFGARHQILTMPPAPREVLQPILTRELRRFYPELFGGDAGEPIVDFMELQPREAGAAAQKELLVAAVPRDLLETVSATVRNRGMHLDHWTIVPRSMQRLYDAFRVDDATAAALIMVPGWPLLGFFHDSELRLFSEPRSGPSASANAGMAAVVEHVERGAIFLRQQFRGAAVGRLYLSADNDADGADAAAELSSRLSFEVTPFGPAGEAPGAFAALGAALDAIAGDGLNLLPVALRPPTIAHRRGRALALASAAFVLLLAVAWSVSAARAERDARSDLQALSTRLSARQQAISAIEPIVRDRRSHAQRASLLEALARERRRLPEVLWPLQASSADVAIRQLSVSRQPDGWDVQLAVTAIGESYDQAADAVTALGQQIGAELPQDAVNWGGIELDRVVATGPDGESIGPGPIAANAQMTFVVPILADTIQ